MLIPRPTRFLAWTPTLKTEFGTARIMTDGVKIWKLLFLALALTSLKSTASIKHAGQRA
jgi:hypothetical protein